MKAVRKDVQAKLIKGLANKRLEHALRRSSLPKMYEYDTVKAHHAIWIYENEYHFSSTLYDGTKCYSTRSILKED